MSSYTERLKMAVDTVFEEAAELQHLMDEVRLLRRSSQD